MFAPIRRDGVGADGPQIAHPAPGVVGGIEVLLVVRPQACERCVTTVAARFYQRALVIGASQTLVGVFENSHKLRLRTLVAAGKALLEIL